MIKKLIYKKFIQPKDSYFRAGAGVIIVNNSDEFVMFERADKPGSFQFSQGGLDVGEVEQVGALRELYEETGIRTTDCTILGEIPGWHTYLYPFASGSYRGQTQRWYLARLNPEHNIDLDSAHDDEFISYKWVSREDVLSEIVEFKREMYKILLEEVGKILLENR